MTEIIPPKPASHTIRNIEGWAVRVDDRLLQPENEVFGTRIFKALPTGKHSIVVARSFGVNSAEGTYSHSHWTGDIASKPLEVEILN